MAVRDMASARRLPMSEELAGRAAAAEGFYPGVMGGRLTVVTLYLQTGMSDEEPSRVLLSSVGVFARSRTGMVILAGDMQMTPEQLGEPNFAWKARITILPSPSARLRCDARMGKRFAST